MFDLKEVWFEVFLNLLYYSALSTNQIIWWLFYKNYPWVTFNSFSFINYLLKWHCSRHLRAPWPLGVNHNTLTYLECSLQLLYYKVWWTWNSPFWVPLTSWVVRNGVEIAYKLPWDLINIFIYKHFMRNAYFLYNWVN